MCEAPSSLKEHVESVGLSDLRVPLDVIEKDYGLTYVLTAVCGNKELARSLVFKGGTALRKAYFPD